LQMYELYGYEKSDLIKRMIVSLCMSYILSLYGIISLIK